MPRRITADQIDFGPQASTPVVSDTLRFLLPVPAFGEAGEPLVSPETGEPFVDRDGKAITGRGLVFFNPDDRSWQAARGDGRGVVLFNPITSDQAERLAAKVSGFAADPNDLTLAQFKAVLDFARGELGIVSQYNTSRDYVASAMTPADPEGPIPAYGLYRRNRQDLCQAVFVLGAGVFHGPAASPQRFGHGAVIVRHGAEVRLVQPVVFEATYKHADGRALKAADLAVQSP
jgi:hypothetical protein